jgi:hypothetical protein
LLLALQLTSVLVFPFTEDTTAGRAVFQRDRHRGAVAGGAVDRRLARVAVVSVVPADPVT